MDVLSRRLAAVLLSAITGGATADPVEPLPEMQLDPDATTPEARPWRREGRLLLWNTEACYRDPQGVWWFVTAFDHFHRAHPRGDRRLAKPVEHFPDDVLTPMIQNDFQWAASNRERIVFEWRTRYDAKTEKKKD